MEAAASRPVRAQRAPRPVGEGHGRRLTAAFEALEGFPALAEPRDRLLRLVRNDRPPVGELVAAVESDLALSVAVLRLANRAGGRRGRPVTSIPAAVEVLGPAGVEAIGSRVRVFDFFERTPAWDREPERFRQHAVATQRAADRVARELNLRDAGEVLAGALLHDVGRLVLIHAYPGYPEEVHGDARTPEKRIQRERRELGIDHALVGGVLVRRWGLPAQLATIVERHHSEDADGGAAIVRVANMLAHHGRDQCVEPGRLLEAARTVGLSPAALRRIMYELPNAPAGRRASEPSPLSERETEILRGLAEGKVYKAIAKDLGLSTSTVRTHLHNTYGKVGAVDRAQAVLIATGRGWL
ncbi:MAG TPA: HDOD domain-containing protein [Thermoleophilaceae bacterium]|nr:HDOD domain-containing protein [Thermoleophilaceae bacterium]